jgi:2'-5' RNA ligase
MRLFTALDPSAEVLENLKGLLERLRPTAPLRWNRAENLHLTLKFIGQWPEPELPALREALGKVPAPPPFGVTVRGLGFFPHARAPRVFWAGVEAAAGLAQLVAQIDQALLLRFAFNLF